MARLGRVGVMVLLAVAFLASTAAQGDNLSDVFQPSTEDTTPKQPKPATPQPRKPAGSPTQATSPLVGDWAREDEGNATCGRTTMRIGSNGGRLSGTTSTGGKVSQISVSGRSFSLVEDYTDVFGDAVTIRYSGELSADGNSATATISGRWQGGCTSKFTRLSGG